MDSKYINELLDLSIFKCKYCKRRCQYPVMNVESIGNYCSSCLTHIKFKTADENTDINSILEIFKIPCRYNNNGCDVAEKIKDITEHEKICDYRDKICPLYELELYKCQHKFVCDIPDHFNSEHKQYVIQSIDNSVKLKLNIKSLPNGDNIRLLVVNHEHFLLHAKFDVDNNNLLYVLYFCGDPDDIKNFQCTIQQNNKNIHTTNMKFNISHASEYIQHINIEKAIHYDLTILKKCFDDEMETLIKFTHKLALTNVKNNDLLNILKCITCETFLRGEIQQCDFGHSVCTTCLKLKKCSVCKARFSGTRNYILENLSLLLKYPCRHKGCNKYFSSKNIAQHESDCVLKEYDCPFTEAFDCEISGKYKDIIDHIKKDHPENLLLDSYFEKTISLNDLADEFQGLCVLTFNNIFLFEVEKETDFYYFNCKYYGIKNLAKRYTFETGLISHLEKNNKLIVKESWEWNQESDNELWVETWGEIHEHNIKRYVNESNEIILFCRISKH